MKKVTIIGSGSWGIALAIHLAKMGHKVKVWSFAKEEADLINNERKCKFLPNVNLPEGIECVLDYKEAIEGSEIILHVTPSGIITFLSAFTESHAPHQLKVLLAIIK